MYMISKQLKIEGFIVLRWHDRWQEAFVQMDDWIKEVREKLIKLHGRTLQHTQSFISIHS